MLPVVQDLLSLGHGLDRLVKKQINEYPFITSRLGDDSAHGLYVAAEWAMNGGVVQNGSVRVKVISMIGPLTKYGDLCNDGMQNFGAKIVEANGNPEVDGIVLLIDSPGGSVDGTPELANIIKNSSKPIVAFGDGTVASAAMWIASQTSAIVGNKNNPTSFGSIGALAIDQDFTNLMEGNRMQRATIIRAPQSTEKALFNAFESSTENVVDAVREELRGIVNDFVAAVKAGRGDALDAKADGLFKGRMFDAYQAKQIGLIDSVGTLQTALNKVAELVKERKKYKMNGGPAASENTMSKPNWFASIFGESKNEAAGLTEEQAQEEGKKEVAALRASLKAAEDEKAELSARISTLQTEAAAQQATILKLTSEVQALGAQLANAPTGNATTVIPDAEREANVAADGKESATKSKYRTSADDEAEAYLSAIQFKN